MEKTEYDLQMIEKWLSIKKIGEEIDTELLEYCKKRNYKKIALYGGGKIGSILWDLLRNRDTIDVLYIVDNWRTDIDGTRVIKTKDIPYEENPDVLVITVPFYFNQILSQLKGTICCPIVSIEDILLRREEKNGVIDTRDNPLMREAEELYTSFLNNYDISGVLNRFHYSALASLYQKINNKEYNKLFSWIIENQIRNHRIGNKKVGFVADYYSLWCFDGIIEKLRDSGYETYAIVPTVNINNCRDAYAIKNATCDYLNQTGINIIVLDNADNKAVDELGLSIIFYQRPYSNIYVQKELDLQNIRLSCMTMLVPYSYWIQKECCFDFDIENSRLFCMTFCPSRFHYSYYVDTLGIGSDRVEMSGYPKNDVFYQNDGKNTSGKYWKGNGRNRVIYAPGINDHSTFKYNHMDILNWAKESKNSIQWVLRLHPDMKNYCLRDKIFNEEKQYYEYVEEWEDLPNAYVSEAEAYYSIFLQSDAMITDAVSFVPNYQHVHKPLFYLSKKEQRYSELGKKLIRNIYVVESYNILDLKRLFEKVVICNEDILREQRDLFFRNNLDYYAINGQLASDYISNHIISITCKYDR